MGYLSNRFKAFRYAVNGLFVFFKEEQHAKIHLFVFLFVLIGGFYFDISKIEWIVLLLTSALVFGLEMINSALERALNRIHPEQHEVIGKAKDIAAGAVLITAIFAVLIGIMVFLPYVQALF